MIASPRPVVFPLYWKVVFFELWQCSAGDVTCWILVTWLCSLHRWKIKTITLKKMLSLKDKSERKDTLVWTNAHMRKLPYLPMNFHSIHCAVWNLYSNKSFLLVRFEFEWISPVYPPNINMEAPCTWQEKINNKLYRQRTQNYRTKDDTWLHLSNVHYMLLLFTTLTGTEHKWFSKTPAMLQRGCVQPETFMHAEVRTILDWNAAMIGSKLSVNTA
jgi:hypothetical protein